MTAAGFGPTVMGFKEGCKQLALISGLEVFLDAIADKAGRVSIRMLPRAERLSLAPQ